MSDTPETDAAWLEQKDTVLLCRKLERERDEAREEVKLLQAILDIIRKDSQ